MGLYGRVVGLQTRVASSGIAETQLVVAVDSEVSTTLAEYRTRVLVATNTRISVGQIVELSLVH